MKNSNRLVFAALASLVLVAAALAWPTTHRGAQPAVITEQTPAAPQSVSGKIASVAKDSFTLTVGSGQTSGGHQIASEPPPQTMTFQIDKNTTIEGKLKVNANADVTYREDGGNNIAISVHVTP